MLTKEYILRSLGIARTVISNEKAVSGDLYTNKPRPKPEKPDFIKEGEFKV
jgi:hypothetical protein